MAEMTEHRITWEAGSHYGFGGATDWMSLDGQTPDEMSESLSQSNGGLPLGLELAIEGSQFSWNVEFR